MNKNSTIKEYHDDEKLDPKQKQVSQTKKKKGVYDAYLVVTPEEGQKKERRQFVQIKTKLVTKTRSIYGNGDLY